MNIKQEIDVLKQELINLRRDFHRYPELGFQEFRTSKIISDYLEKCGLEVRREVAKTGVVGLLRGTQPGKTILLRSDMDALPVLEENDIPFKSVNKGVMHACGHDGHIAMLLIAAKILSNHRDKIKGNIKFVFQPNEEDAGAQIMVREGILEDPKVDAALGIHLWSLIKTGEIGIVPGPIMASSYYFKLIIKGKGGHGGAPHRAINPINPAANIIQAIKTMQSDELDPLKPTIITVCKINCGTKSIIIPEKIELEGSIRCLHDGTKEVQKRFEEVVKNICEAHKTTYELEFKCGNILLNNDARMTELVKEIAADVVGKENIKDSNVSVMLGEDFAEFTERVPGAFYFVGISDKEKRTDYPHHHPKFNIDEDMLSIGVEMHVRGSLEYLNKNI